MNRAEPGATHAGLRSRGVPKCLSGWRCLAQLGGARGARPAAPSAAPLALEEVPGGPAEGLESNSPGSRAFPPAAGAPGRARSAIAPRSPRAPRAPHLPSPPAALPAPPAPFAATWPLSSCDKGGAVGEEALPSFSFPPPARLWWETAARSAARPSGARGHPLARCPETPSSSRGGFYNFEPAQRKSVPRVQWQRTERCVCEAGMC